MATQQVAQSRFGWVVLQRERLVPTSAVEKESIMSVFAWITLGLVAGFIASEIVIGTGQGAVVDIVLGAVGAVIGGWLFSSFGLVAVGGFTFYGLLVAVLCATVLLVVYHAVAARQGSVEKQEASLPRKA
jgi:uncharacterized membrane protein YeaQ/YmgE (transglycosylase-associated protein family)